MIKRVLFLFMLLFSHISVSAGITDLKLSTAQIFDVQWNISGGRLNASGFNYIFASVNYATQTTSAARWTAAQTAEANSNGRYIGFFNSTTNPGTYGMAVFNSDGTIFKIINNTGSFRALADGAIFYNGNGMWGTLITTKQGYSLGQNGSWAVTQDNPTNTQLQAYTPPSSTPLASGQTAGPPPPAPTAIYMNNATVRITRAIPTTSNSPGSEGPNNAFDNNPNTKYLNFDKKNAGVTVQLNTGRVVTGFTVTTANDFSGRDPTSYKLYGSNDGVTWTLIKEDNLTLSDNRFTTSSVIGVGNTAAYAYYFMLFPTTKAGDGCGLNCDSMQIAEITYYYDANSTTTSTASSNTIVDPVTAASGPTVEGGTITQTNAPSNQTITSGGTSSAGISGAQQTRVNTWINSAGSRNLITVDQVYGSNNTVEFTQTGNKNEIDFSLNGNNNVIKSTQTGSNYLKMEVPGWGNTVTTNQSNTTGTHYVETRIQGNGNIVNHTQTGNANKILFSVVQGDINTLTTSQTGTGAHFLETKMTGNSNSIIVDQNGSTANKANIDITNAGGAATVDLIQSGGKNFTIIQSCVNPAGCSTIVRQ
jgi:hypothetical protein